jgi:hypothetical protein
MKKQCGVGTGGTLAKKKRGTHGEKEGVTLGKGEEHAAPLLAAIPDGGRRLEHDLLRALRGQAQRQAQAFPARLG